LHLNQTTFIGQKDIQQYIAIRQVKDAFYGLLNDKDQTKLATWDILTGKLMSEWDLHDVNLTAYQRFKCKEVDCFQFGLHDHTLLVSNEPTNHDEDMLAQFFEP
jgi:hypothetical protein